MHTRPPFARDPVLYGRRWAEFRIPPRDPWYVRSRLTAFLREYLHGMVYVHATLVNVSGAGVLIRGTSGSGKSRCALELIRRGHRLVADDLVCIRRGWRGRLYGSSHRAIKNLIEVPERGIVNALEQFGASAISGSVPVDVVFELMATAGAQETVADICEHFRVLGCDLPVIRWSGSAGDNTADSVERAAANSLS